ncbi:hypothetical protein BGZ49_008260 [Haplosporangium sp. Z 27]|nr:hypothetical protein BGZ49_008260 [Haplosporangium sp. Z 27]
MVANPGRRTESISSGSDHISLHNNSGSTSLIPPDPNRPRSSSSSKALLTMALMEAQSAVQLDNANDILGALDAYQKAVNLLGKVMEVSQSADEQERLRTIHDSYLFRIHLLSTPPTPTSAEPLAQQSLSDLPQQPPPQQPLPPSPSRQPNPPRATNSITSTLASITPASSSNTISSQQNGDDSTSDGTQISSSVTQVTPARRTRKNIPGPIQPPPPVSGLNIQLPSEIRTQRQRSGSTSTAEHGNAHGHPRHHNRSHTGGSNYRMTGDLVHAAEQLHIQSQHRLTSVPKVRSRDHLGVPIHSAPTVPLPPTPALGQPPSTPPPVSIPSGHGSSSSTPTHSNPSTPNMSTNNTFTPSLPSSPPPRAPLPPAPINFTSPPASPANNSRRVSPLVTSSPGQSQQQVLPQQQGSKSFQSPPDSSPEEEKSNDSASKFYDDDLVSDEWLPNLASTSFSTAEASLEHSSEDPYPRDRVTSKGSFTGSQLEQVRPKSIKGPENEGSSAGDSVQQKQQRSSSQHQRSFSQSSNASAHHSISSQTRSPLAAPMYSFQQGASSISSLHALDGGSIKRNSDSSRSLKEASPLGRSSGSPVTNGTGTVGSSPLSSSPGQPTRPSILQHQHSSSKLNSTISSSSSVASPVLDKAWSPSMSSTYGNGSSGGMTLYDVISDDPFVNMTFPFPPSIEQPPTDPYLRCFWLMRRLEQTMTTGGFLTKRMYVPRTIWYQSLVRLPAADSKMSACQTLNTLFTKLAKQSQSGHLNLLVEGGPEGDAERMTILKELEALETAAINVQTKLSKKLSFIQRPGKNGLSLTISTNQSYSEDAQGPTTGNASVYGAASLYGDSHNWSTNDEPPLPTSGVPAHEKSIKKGGVSVGGSAPDASIGGLKSQWKSFSKSVQKSIVNDKVDDTSNYTEAIVRLFQSSYILESMLRHYAPSPFQLNIQISNRLRRLCDVLSQVICAFVVRDLGELMGKYVKRVGAWVAD